MSNWAKQLDYHNDFNLPITDLENVTYSFPKSVASQLFLFPVTDSDFLFSLLKWFIQSSDECINHLMNFYRIWNYLFDGINCNGLRWVPCITFRAMLKNILFDNNGTLSKYCNHYHKVEVKECNFAERISNISSLDCRV